MDKNFVIGFFNVFSVLFGMLFVLPSHSQAKDQTQDYLLEISLEELMNISFNTASKHLETINDAPSVSTIISSEQIARFGANSLYEVLARVTSVYMTGSNFFPKNVMAMRGVLLGHYDNHILLLLNGRPLRESYDGGVNFSIYNALPLNIINRIEIIRGPGSVLYGSNAYAGVVNIITKLPSADELILSAGTGTFDSKFVELLGAQVTDNLSIQWAVKYFDEQGWNFAAIDNNGVTGNKDYGERNVAGFVSGTIENFAINALYTKSSQDFIGASTSWLGQPPVDERTMDSDRLFLDLGYSHQFSADWYLDSNISYGKMNFDHYNYSAYSQDTFAELTNHWQINEQLRWVIGATMWYQHVGSTAGLAAAPVPEFNSTWYALYSQIAYKLTDPLTFVIGAQLNKAKHLTLDVVPRIGAIYRWSERMGIKLMYAEAYRAAFGVETGFELILKNEDGSIRGGLRGNPKLSPETIATTDLQFYYNTDGFQLATTYFESRLQNLVGRVRAADKVLDFVNEGEVTSHGFELEGKVNINQQFHLIANYSYQTNQNGNHIENYMTVPNTLIKIGGIYYFGTGHSFALFDNYVGAATDIEVQNPARKLVNPPADSYHLVSAKLSLDLKSVAPQGKLNNSKVELYIYNLFNQAVYQPEFIGKLVNTLPADSGRNVTLQFIVKF
jgi:outer membrane receptor for ferrienterochelin and colicins